MYDIIVLIYSSIGLFVKYSHHAHKISLTIKIKDSISAILSSWNERNSFSSYWQSAHS